MNHRPRLIVIADELRARRLAAVLTVHQLAEKAELSPATIKALEAQDSSASPNTVRKLSIAFGCLPQDISRVTTVEVAS